MEKTTTNVTTDSVETAVQMPVPYVIGPCGSFWRHILDGDTAIRVSTGFRQLNTLLDGGVRAGLYVILANPGTGKTTFCLQMADSFARAGSDVIFFSGEMPVSDLLAKIYSRYSYMVEDEVPAMTAADILKLSNNPHATEMAKTLYEAYLPAAARTVIVPANKINTITTIQDIVKDHITATGNVPVVVIDYLQIIASKFGEGTEKQNVDRFLAYIKEVSSQYGVPVVLISSVNRMSYKEELSLGSAKESGGIEYTADVILGLDYRDPKTRGTEYYEEHYSEPRELKIKILKNRMGSWGKVYMKMYGAYSYFEEESAVVSRY